MTDRYHTLTVVLEHDIREDDAKPLIAAICQMRGVASVTGVAVNPQTYMALERARRELSDKLWMALHPPGLS